LRHAEGIPIIDESALYNSISHAMLTAEKRGQDFPSLKSMTYLNTAAESIPPVTVSEALQEYTRDKANGMRGRDAHFAQLAKCRAVAAGLIGLAPPEVSFCSCSAEAYNLLATALELNSGDEIVINDLDFPSGATPWFQHPAQPKIHLWKCRKGELVADDLARLLNAHTRLVQVSLVSFYNGHRLGWRPFIKTVRALAPNAIVAVDITQALGRIALDCSDADCIISSTHKWILGIHGGCIVGIPERASARLTTRTGGWYHLQNAFDPDRFERVIPKKGAESFSVGMPNFPAIYALRAACEYIESIGVEKIAQRADPLVARVHESLSKIGIKPMAPFDPNHTSGIVAFQHPESGVIHEALQKQNIHVMHSAGRIRVSVHGYNTAENVQEFLDAMEKTLP
jgi:cysteine desulfurase/selenocysteine lyase